MKKNILLAASLLSVMTFFSYTSIEKKKPKKPNVIVVLVDDLGYKDVGFNGSKEIPTPNIDRIAHEGVKFTNGYVSYAVCGPSRAGLITGRYQDRFGSGRNPLWAPNDIDQGLSVDEETIADVLGREGYKSMALGKWHLGAHEKLRPLKRGFDEFYGFLTGGHKYFPEEWILNDISEIKQHSDAYKTKLLHNNTRVDEKEYLTDALSREAVRFVDENSDKPFFMYLAYNAPHAPLQATPKYLKRFSHIENKKRKTYCAMVSAVDDGVGLLLDKLDEKGIADNTIVIFLSDNGGTPKITADNAPLRGHKGNLFEGGIRVPFAMRWPNMIAKNSVYERPVISLDIMATAVEYANAKPKKQLDGVNIVPYITKEKQGDPHQSLRWRSFDKKTYTVRMGDMKYIRLYNRKTNKTRQEFYDLSKDISESDNLTLPKEQKKELQKEYDQWVEQMVVPKYLGLLQDKKYSELNPDRFNVLAY
ncbi:sulfatase-like hydrolase/transferase [Flammeovirga agarivorans]|uniref:Sulfatase-like hydrolase/transferase n=1 Tax=Flammeovirga agarivorans TaxID=2726742 RepID=A0A7X8XYX8_9BACT|nr:sulfatase-like hydrolase/transferase [Flammeovirga agarivorans]NLR94563.1 sulfatase-like hydrolase/transferase [Flammeovirga agarivorans]